MATKELNDSWICSKIVEIDHGRGNTSDKIRKPLILANKLYEGFKQTSKCVFFENSTWSKPNNSEGVFVCCKIKRGKCDIVHGKESWLN